MEIDSPHPTDAHARARPPCSPGLRRERRCAATAAAPLRRRPCPTVACRAPPLPNCSLGSVDHARPALPRRRPRRRRECVGAEWPADVGARQGLLCK
jgi:hypothetical protein